MKRFKLSAVPAILSFCAINLHAVWFDLGFKRIDAELQYDVQAPYAGLEAELVFPAKTIAVSGSVKEWVGLGTIKLSVEYALISQSPRGTDKDWQYDSLTVYSDSKTSLNQYYRFDGSYDVPVASAWQLGLSAFYDKWRLTWSDTHQEDYVADTSTVIEENTVRFTQEKWGVDTHIGYENMIASFPLSGTFGLEAAWHKSVDEHLVRYFYTVSEDWMYGYYLALNVTVLHDAESSLSLKGEYRYLSGDADMDFYTLSNIKYNTLPASFESRSFAVSLNYRFGL